MVPFYFLPLRIQMICMIRILAGISPGNMHLTRGQVDDQGRDRVLTVQRIDPFDIVVADRIRQIDVVLLDCLQ